MENGKIIEGNKLIAEFMSGQTNKTAHPFISMHIKDDEVNFQEKDYPKTPHDGSCWKFSELKYYRSWKWLMPAVEKIESMGHPVYIHSNCCTLYEKAGKDHGGIIEEHGATKIEATWECITRWLKYESLINNKE